MICFDTNIIIYIANGTLSEDIVKNDPIVYPSIVEVEALGYPSIRSAEEQKINGLLSTLTVIPLNDRIVKLAVKLRQEKSMSLGDAIVAATAIETNSTLWTANSDDFVHIEDLKIHNPLEN